MEPGVVLMDHDAKRAFLKRVNQIHRMAATTQDAAQCDRAPSPLAEHTSSQNDEWAEGLYDDRSEEENELCRSDLTKGAAAEEDAAATGTANGADGGDSSNDMVIELSSDEYEPEPKRRCSPHADEAFARSLQAKAEVGVMNQQQQSDEAFARALQAEHEAPIVKQQHAIDEDEAFARALQAEDNAVVPNHDDDEAFALKLQAQSVPDTDADAMLARTLSDADGARPVCKYGSSCYNQNREHQQEYRHDVPQIDPQLLLQIEWRERQDAMLQQLDTKLKSGYVPPRKRMRGDSPLMMNKLSSSSPANGPAATPHGVKLPEEVTNAELYWHSPYLQTALLASFGVDYGLVKRMVRLSPADRDPGAVLICDNYAHDTQSAGFDSVTHAPAVVVMPPFFDAAASSGQRARLEKGTMHPKLQVLEFDGGNHESRFLRVIISSANLGDYDGNINNQFWAHDFELEGNQLKTVPGDTKKESPFANDLKRFVLALLKPLTEATGNESWAAQLPTRWMTVLDKYDLTPPAGTHLILSIPGRFRYEERNNYGHLALQTHLRAELDGRANECRPTRIEFASSSVGRLLGIYESFFRSLRTGAVQFNEHGQKIDADVYHLYPSVGQMLLIAQAGDYKDLTSMGMTGPGADWNESWFPRHHFAHHDIPWPHRTRTSHHCKMIAALTAANQLVWQYSGSHNFSGAAWGKFERSTDSAAGSDFVLMSYELGVLYVPSVPLERDQYMIPWVTPVRPYASGTLPWSEGGMGQLADGHDQLVESATSDVLNAAAAAARMHEGDLPLPRLLTVPVGAVSKLVQLQIGGAALPLLQELPCIKSSRSNTGGRRRFRHCELQLSDELSTDVSCKAPTTVVVKQENAAPATVVVKQENAAPATVVVKQENAAPATVVVKQENAAPATVVVKQENAAPATTEALFESAPTEAVKLELPNEALSASVKSEAVSPNTSCLATQSMCNQTADPAGASLAGQQARDSLVAAGTTQLGFLAESVSVGQMVKKGETDFQVNFYQLVRAPTFFLCQYVADRYSSGAAALSVMPEAAACAAPASPAAGFLLVFLAPSSTGAIQNRLLLNSLSHRRLHLDRSFWGVLPLMPSAIDSRGIDWEPSHADTVALMHNVKQLPAIVPISQRSRASLHEPLSGTELFCTIGSEAALERWVEQVKSQVGGMLAAEQATLATQQMFSQGMPELIGSSAAQLVHSLGIQLLLIEPEGALKKRVNVSMKESKDEPGLHDSFREQCVPFLKSVLLEDSPDTRWHPQAPKVALVTDFGQQCSESQDRAPLTEAKVSKVLGKLRARLSNELGVSPTGLDKRLSVDVSFLANSAEALAEDDARHGRPEWSHAWCKPRPDMLLHALKHWGVEPRLALAIGHDSRDQEAAVAAGVNYISWQALFHSLDQREMLVTAGSQQMSVSAPESFAPKGASA